MRRLGFIHDMMDIKVLILFVTARVEYPVSCLELYELCYQDDCVSYFDICTALPEMVNTGHLRQNPDQRYEITEKGRSDGAITEDSIAFTVKQRAESAVERFNRNTRRSSFVKTQVIPREGGDFSVVMRLDDEMGNLMTLELLAPNQQQANRLGKMFDKKAEEVFHHVMTDLLSEEKNLEE